jgi:hypothetical protein
MRRAEKLRLMKKFRVRGCSGGMFGQGFLEGLKAAEDYESKPIIKDEDIEVPVPSRKY